MLLVPGLATGLVARQQPVQGPARRALTVAAAATRVVLLDY